MNDPAQIQKLEEELSRVSQQLSEQQQTINRLREELRQLSGKEPAPAPSFTRPVLRHASLENLIGLRLIHLIGITSLLFTNSY